MDSRNEAGLALGRTGLIAFSRCGHWWVYPCRATVEQMHELARFNLVTQCSFCFADWQAHAEAQARPTAGRIN